jgi:sulfur relay (sulfurtransferase) complex TusBCD TusD component (DsrE family)
MQKNDSVLLFTQNGMGAGPEPLPLILAGRYLSLTIESGEYPAKILFYTEGIHLACSGSPVLDQLQLLETKGVELILCKTCLDFFKRTDQVKAGIIGGMGDILEAIQKADKVITL